MNCAKSKLLKSALVTTVGLGLLIVVAAKRKRIYHYLQNINNPLKHRRIEVVQNLEECHMIVKQLKKHCNELKVLGFDCEWVTVGGTRRPTALLQLASGQGLCALFRLSCMKQIPKSLRDLLEDDEILKVGIAPQGDAQNLSHDYGVGVASTLDLRFLAALTGRKPEGLAKMSKSVLNVEIDKHWRIVCSNWEAQELSEKQLLYAANDALVAVEIFKKLSNDLVRRKFWLSKNDFDTIYLKLEPFYEVNFKEGFLMNMAIDKSSKSTAFSKSKSERKFPKKTQTRGLSTRSRGLYDNCLLEAPDGELLCTIDKRKAKWYLDQCLGIEVKADPFTVRLNFEPAGRARGEVGKYYQSPKENQCVVCGHKETFIRKNVVPREYRKHFPVMKSHTSHDVLLLCPTCHQLSNNSDLKVRHRLGEMCDAPLTNKEGASKLKEIPELKLVKSAARALLKSGDQIPEERRKILEAVILNYYKGENEISYSLLQEASEIEAQQINEKYSQHGEKVVQTFQMKHGGLLKLEKIWREHFIHTMQPKYLPPLWNINHNADRLEIRANEGRINQEDLVVAGILMDHKTNNS
ncbi:exonuclease 3'-5' domain-containing 2 isoform 2-T2 [Cochliomyia hominivorax]